MAISIDPDTLLTRGIAAESLTEAGYPTARATQATLAIRGKAMLLAAGGLSYRLIDRQVGLSKNTVGAIVKRDREGKT